MANNSAARRGSKVPLYSKYAEKYLAAGWMPIPAFGKVIRGKGVTGGSGRDVTDGDVRQWSRDYPDSNIALRIPYGCIGIDVDDYGDKKGAESLAALESRIGPLPDTHLITSRAKAARGRSGIRLYRIPEEFHEVHFPGGAGDGIEILTHWYRYFMAPPSIHPETDLPYRAIRGGTAHSLIDFNPGDLPLLPASWCKGLQQADPQREAAVRATTTSQLRTAALEAGDGEQREALLRIVRKWQHRGYDKEDIYNLFVQLVSEMPTYPSDKGPWWPAKGRDPDKWFKSLLLREGSFIPDATPEEMEGINDWEPKRDRSALLKGIRTGDWLDAQDLPPITFAVPGVLPAGFAILAGAPKMGKSLLAHMWCLQVARGGKVFGTAVDKRAVLYLALEDGDLRIQTRSRELLGGGRIPAGFSYMLTVAPGKLIPTVGAFLDLNPEGMVVVDTLGKVLEKPQQGETTYDRDYRLTSMLKRQADEHPGSIVLATHHTRKAASNDFVDMVSGTNGITGGVDTVLSLSRKRGEREGVLNVIGRDVEDGEYALTIERPHGWVLDGEDLFDSTANAVMRRHKMGDRMAELVSFVSGCDGGVTAADVCSGTGIEMKEVRVYLKRAVDSGYISWIRRGLYGAAAKSRVSI